MKELKGKTCLVTGGTRGIGEATVYALAEAGADVIFTYQHSKDQAVKVAARAAENGVKAEGYQADVATESEVQSVLKEAIDRFGPVNILVNNAGITRDKSFIKMTRPMWDEVRRVNLDGLFVMTQAVLPGMLEAGWGRIINLSSIVGQTGNFGQANYAATKGAVIGFSKTLAREVARKGVTVNVVAPGFTETDMVKDMPQAGLDQVKSLTPIGRLGRPEEIADAVVYLARPAASYVTGQVLAVNGGMYM